MWAIGHCALAYFVTRSWLSANGIAGSDLNEVEDRGSRTKYTRPVVDGWLILLIWVFGNLPDLFHIYALRNISHSLMGATGLLVLALYLVNRFKLARRWQWPFLIVAYLSHILGDIMLSNFLPLYPFSSQILSLFPWNSIEDVAIESVMLIAMLAAMMLNGDYARFKALVRSENQRFWKHWHLRDIFKPRWHSYYVLGLFYLFVGLQFAIVSSLRFLGFIQYSPVRWGFLLAFLLFVVTLLWPLVIKEREQSLTD